MMLVGLFLRVTLEGSKEQHLRTGHDEKALQYPGILNVLTAAS